MTGDAPKMDPVPKEVVESYTFPKRVIHSLMYAGILIGLSILIAVSSLVWSNYQLTQVVHDTNKDRVCRSVALADELNAGWTIVSDIAKRTSTADLVVPLQVLDQAVKNYDKTAAEGC